MADRDTSRQCGRLLPVLPAVLALMLVSGIETVAGTERSISASLPGGLLSTPMPGTRAREHADLAARLEKALKDFDGVERATVIISDSPDATTASRAAIIQMTLSDGFVGTATWLDALRTFSLRTIPHLDPASLTVIDTTGRILLDAGDMHLAAPEPASAIGVVDETFRLESWWPWTAGGVGFLLVIAAVAVQLSLRREREAVAPEPEPGPLSFLESLPDEQLADVLVGERVEVIAAVHALASETLTARLRGLDGLPPDPPLPSAPPDAAMRAALAEALSERLVRT